MARLRDILRGWRPSVFEIYSSTWIGLKRHGPVPRPLLLLLCICFVGYIHSIYNDKWECDTNHTNRCTYKWNCRVARLSDYWLRTCSVHRFCSDVDIWGNPLAGLLILSILYDSPSCLLLLVRGTNPITNFSTLSIVHEATFYCVIFIDL